MHQEQLSLEESWQLSVFSKHNEQGAGQTHMGQSEERGEGLNHGDWDSANPTGTLKKETKVLFMLLSRDHTE